MRPFDDTDETLIALPGERKRISTIAGENVAADTIHVTLKDDTADQYSLYGLGLYLENGVLFAVYSQAVPIMEKSPAAMLLLAADMQFTKIDAAQLYFGDATFTNPPATTERQGVVELATNAETLAGTDTQRAVTPASLQSTLTPALATKSNVGHRHAIVEVDGLQSALDSKFDKSGGDLGGQLRVAEGTVSAPGLSFVNDSVADTGLWHIADGAFGISTNGVEQARFTSTGMALTRRPVFAGATPWDTGNFNPANYLPLLGGDVNGQLGIVNGSSIRFQASNGYTAYLRGDQAGLVGFINQAQNQWNVQINDNGTVVFPRARPNWMGLTPWDSGNFNPGSYAPRRSNNPNAGYVGCDTGNSLIINWDGNFRIFVDGQYGSALWGTHNFDPSSKLTRGTRTEAAGTTLSSGSPPGISGIVSSGNGANVALTIANSGNGSASAVIAFLRDGQYGAFFGLDTDNQWAVGGWSMGNVRYRIWHEGNFNPNSYVPIRNGANANGGYVVTDTGNRMTFNWTGSTQFYVDNSYQGDLIHTNNYINWCAPRSVMDYGGIGSYTYMNTGGNPGVNQLVNLPGLGGTWRVMSGAFGASGKDILYVRIG